MLSISAIDENNLKIIDNMEAKEIIAAAKDKMSSAIDHLDSELKNFRAGKANTAVFNNVMVNY